MRGTVRFFDRTKKDGQILSSDGQNALEFDVSGLLEELVVPLYIGEEVDFDIGTNEQGEEIAIAIRRLKPRFQGTVKNRGPDTWWICPEGSENGVYAHYTNILGNRRFRRLENGEKVEYCVEAGSRGPQAVAILQLDTRPELLRFATCPHLDVLTEQLENITADGEDWEYRYTQSSGPRPVLRSYLLHTFARIAEEKKISECEDDQGRPIACFNTGLATKRQEGIFAFFSQANQKNGSEKPPWRFDCFAKESDFILTHFATKPDVANYFEDPTELIYDSRMKLECNIGHITKDNVGRFPPTFQKNEHALQGALFGAIEAAKGRIRRNYKTAIPNYYRGSVTLLLPLCLVSPEQADLALAVRRVNKVYRAATVLTLDMAYNNARLIAKPDREWLNP